MSLKRQELGPVPDDTARVARAAFKRKPNVYVRFADEFPQAFSFEDFAAMFSSNGKLAEHPARLALIMIVQYAEGLSDREVMEAIVARIDLKYLLRLPLNHEGFDFSILSEFRSRLVKNSAEDIGFNKLLQIAAAGGMLGKRKQRTDSTHVIAAVRDMGRVELLIETVRAALEQLSVIVPDWTLALAPSLELTQAYVLSSFSYRISRKQGEREKVASTVGRDGFRILDKIDSDNAYAWLSKIPAIVALRKIWDQQFDRKTRSEIRFRNSDELPVASERLSSHRDLEARSSTKRSLSWLGFKVHVTETCDSSLPNLITNVLTTASTTSDMGTLPIIQEMLIKKNLKPDMHLVDAGYTKAEEMLTSLVSHGVEVVGPCREGNSWHTATPGSFDISRFAINWEVKNAVCPMGITSNFWRERKNRRAIAIEFPKQHCLPCPARAQCTKSKSDGRQLEVKPQNITDFLTKHRKKLSSKEYKAHYAQRAGVEGTISQLSKKGRLRFARYIGLTKTNLQNLWTATAINFLRLSYFLLERPKSKTRVSKYGTLIGQAA